MIIFLILVGALTSKAYSFSARPWELKQIEAVDFTDSLHSNLIFNLRTNKVVRVLPKINPLFNGEWISDRTRFFYDGFIPPNRLEEIYFLKNKISWRQALSRLKTSEETPGLSLQIVLNQLIDLQGLFFLKQVVALSNSSVITTFLGKSLFEHRRDYTSFDLFIKLQRCDTVLLIGQNPRVCFPILNLQLQMRTKNSSDFQVGFLGNFLSLNYKFTYFGNSYGQQLNLIFGKSVFGRFFANSKQLLLLTADNVNTLCLAQIKDFIKRYTKITFFKLISSPAAVNFCEILGVINRKNESKHFFNRSTIKIGENKNVNIFINSVISLNSYISSKMQYTLELPITNFLESKMSFLNILGHIKTIQKVIFYQKSNLRSLVAIFQILGNLFPAGLLQQPRWNLHNILRPGNFRIEFTQNFLIRFFLQENQAVIGNFFLVDQLTKNSSMLTVISASNSHKNSIFEQ